MSAQWSQWLKSLQMALATALVLLFLVCFVGVFAPKAMAGSSLADLDATRERPLFSPNRRLPPKPVVPVEPPPRPPVEAPPPNLQLVGVIFSENEKRAIVIVNNPAKPQSLKPGDAIDGWQVSLIEPRKIALNKGERSIDFTLKPKRP
ncbi:hypothetical protein [Beijerinckia indica]|uniref:Type II secretion system protein GspC N-terminal domain-containing protein n=1 Tax=Beijerinckia indica subsp. indica (strain ATCC 9039 / DSM 1715 / NCIMB 8712) TaxID=395963 RepID=B2IBD7_BEII9|nr:hypothetical protein [Beijerinckia indica]ACB95224.1 hypothetical protein Bind_1592 [Beijerinckia indica subsp. indica ATCC 9039]